MAITDGWENIIDNEINRVTNNIVERIESDIENESPVFSGEYKRSVYAEIKNVGEQLTGRIGNSVEYAELIEYGANRIDANRAIIEDWARKRLGVSGKQELSKTGYMITKKLRESGIEGKKVFYNAWIKNQAYINEQIKKLEIKLINKINSSNNTETIII